MAIGKHLDFSLSLYALFQNSSHSVLCGAMDVDELDVVVDVIGPNNESNISHSCVTTTDGVGCCCCRF